MSDLRRLAQDPTFLGLFAEGGIVYRTMEAAEAQLLNPATPLDKVRVLQGRLQGLRGVRDLVVQVAQSETPDTDTIPTPDQPRPRLMRVVEGAS